MTDRKADTAQIVALVASEFGAWAPQAVVFLHYPDGDWKVSAAFQSVHRALRSLDRSNYDKPHAVYCVMAEAPGYLIEFFEADH